MIIDSGWTMRRVSAFAGLLVFVHSPFVAAQSVPGPVVTFKDAPKAFSCVVTTRRACTTRTVPRQPPAEYCVTEAVSVHFKWAPAPRDEKDRPYYIFELGSGEGLMQTLRIDGSSHDLTMATPLRSRSASFWLRKVDGTRGHGYPSYVSFTVKDDLQGDIPCTQR
jgi:hypothetical protein